MFSAPSPTRLEKEGMEMEIMTDHAYLRKPIKSQKFGFRELPHGRKHPHGRVKHPASRG